MASSKRLRELATINRMEECCYFHVLKGGYEKKGEGYLTLIPTYAQTVPQAKAYMKNLIQKERGADITMTVFPPMWGIGAAALLLPCLPQYVYLPKTMMLNEKTTYKLLGILQEMAQQNKGRI